MPHCPKHWSIVEIMELNRQLASRVTSRFSAEQFPPLTLLAARVLPFALSLASLSIMSCWIEINWVGQKRTCCNVVLFPGNRDLLSKTLGGPILPLVCGFIRRDNLRAWRELFTNLYKLKSRIWFLEEYIHFERIYRVCRFDGLSWNFARTFQQLWQTEECREILIFNTVSPWRPFTQHVLHIFSYSI